MKFQDILLPMINESKVFVDNHNNVYFVARNSFYRNGGECNLLFYLKELYLESDQFEEVHKNRILNSINVSTSKFYLVKVNCDSYGIIHQQNYDCGKYKTYHLSRDLTKGNGWDSSFFNSLKESVDFWLGEHPVYQFDTIRELMEFYLNQTK